MASQNLSEVNTGIGIHKTDFSLLTPLDSYEGLLEQHPFALGIPLVVLDLNVSIATAQPHV
jgi:hypothetical protein